MQLSAGEGPFDATRFLASITIVNPQMVPIRLMFAESWWKVSRVFPALPRQIAQARRFLRRMLDGCPAVDDAVLICSELATNAVLHSDSARPGGLFTVRAEVRDGDYVWLEVEDQGGRWVSREPSETSGRGLAIVAPLADYWDVRGDDTARAVCARLDWPVPTAGPGSNRRGLAPRPICPVRGQL